MPSLAKRLLQVPVLSSIASTPRSPATSVCAQSMSRCLFISMPLERRSPSGIGSGRRRDRAVDDRLRLLQDPLQMVGAREALGVDLVDVLGPRRTRCEPTTVRDDLDAADGRAVARRLVEHGVDLLAGELAGIEPVGRERGELLLLRLSGWCLDPIGERAAEVLRELVVEPSRVATAAGRD